MSSDIELLEAQGKQILEGHKDIVLVSEEVNKVWELEVTELTPALRAVIIESLRNNRKNFAAKKAKSKAKKLSTPVPEGGIQLADLDLELDL